MTTADMEAAGARHKPGCSKTTLDTVGKLTRTTVGKTSKETREEDCLTVTTKHKRN